MQKKISFEDIYDEYDSEETEQLIQVNEKRKFEIVLEVIKVNTKFSLIK